MSCNDASCGVNFEFHMKYQTVVLNFVDFPTVSELKATLKVLLDCVRS